MVQLHLATTPNLKELLCQVHTGSAYPSELKSQLAPYLSEASIPFDLVKACYVTLCTPIPFRTWIQGSKVVFPDLPPKKPKSPELLKVLAEAQKIVDAQAYFEMTGRSFESHAPNPPSKSVSDTQFLICVANIGISVVSVFAAVIWIASEYQLGTHVLVAFFAGLVVLAAEAVLAYRAT